jgi:hypothetical protein
MCVFVRARNCPCAELSLRAFVACASMTMRFCLRNCRERFCRLRFCPVTRPVSLIITVLVPCASCSCCFCECACVQGGMKNGLYCRLPERSIESP